jgi:hypothetical protein
MPLLKSRSVIAAKVETTIGTDVSPGASDGAWNAYNAKFTPEMTMEDREGQGGFNRLSAVAGPRLGKMTFSTDLGWDGSGIPPWAGVLFPCCGWVNNGSGVFYPKSEAPGTNVKTCTMGLWQDGMLQKITGAVGTFKMMLVAGKMIRIDWEFTGVWSYATTDTALISPTYPTGGDAIPLRFAAATACSWNSVAMAVESITIDAGNSVVPMEDATKDAGYGYCIITDRYPKITANPEAVLVATQGRDAAWLSMAENPLVITLDGYTTSTVSINAPKAQLTKVVHGDRNKVITQDLEFSCNKNGATADQELYFTFTEAS